MMRLRPISLAFLLLAPACASQSPSEQAQPSDKPADTGETPTPTSSDPLTAALERAWAAAEIEASPLASDAAFIRRASLDLIGRIPTHTEVERFLTSETPNKRAALIDALLESESFAGHWAALWSARLLPGDKQGQRYTAAPLESFLSTALLDNRPWSTVVEQLVGSEGLLDDQPELAYVASRKLRGKTKQEAVAELSSTTARVFLGARIECAQCHDHPYVSEFSREDFWAQAAYFGRTLVAVDKDKKKKNKNKNPPTIEISEREKGELRVALGGEQEPGKVLFEPRFLGADAPDPALDNGESSRRALLASSIVSNSRFAEATVGWVWTQLLGSGIVEPWDDLLSSRERPELLALLAEDFRANDHDLRALIRQVVLSPAYQRSSAGPQAEPAAIALAEASFARARVRPLSAEQLFASLLTVTQLEQVDNKAFRRAVRGNKATALREYEFVFADDEMGASDGFSGNVPQALLLLNGIFTNQGVIVREGSSLDRILASGTIDEQLTDLWLTVYGRPPRSEELEFGREAVGTGKQQDWEDLMFAMIYSSEFGSNH